jgi:hypothetical protein
LRKGCLLHKIIALTHYQTPGAKELAMLDIEKILTYHWHIIWGAGEGT